MNPWPYVALTVLGTIGMAAAFRPWYDELNMIADWEKATGRSTTLHQRRKLIFWVIPALVFGIVGAVGDAGLIIYFAGKALS